MAGKPKKGIVVKIGGSTFNSGDTILEDLVALQRAGTLPVVVHGGGHRVSNWLSRLGIDTEFIQGLRITDADTLEVVTEVLGGLVNKELVAAIISLGGRAIGMSGVDGGFIEARIITPELGYAGEVVKVNPEPLESILASGYIPVVAPVSLHDSGGLININGDDDAGEIAVAIGAERLIFLSDVEGIWDNQGSLISHLSQAEARVLIEQGVASKGMVPKIEACLRALPRVPITRIIDGRLPHALLQELEGRGGGTTIG